MTGVLFDALPIINIYYHCSPPTTRYAADVRYRS